MLAVESLCSIQNNAARVLKLEFQGISRRIVGKWNILNQVYSTACFNAIIGSISQLEGRGHFTIDKRLQEFGPRASPGLQGA